MDKHNFSAGDIYFEIQEEVIDLCCQWKAYQQIYFSSSFSGYDTDSPIFFRHLRKILEGTIILTITKLFNKAIEKDRNGNVKSYNLGFLYLIEQLEKEGYKSIDIENLKKPIAIFKDRYKSSVFWLRNKKLAHNDFPTIRKNEYEEKNAKVFQEVNLETIIDSIVNLTNDIVEILLDKSIIPNNPNNFYAHAPSKLAYKSINMDADKMVKHLINTKNKK